MSYDNQWKKSTSVSAELKFLGDLNRKLHINLMQYHLKKQNGFLWTAFCQISEILHFVQTLVFQYRNASIKRPGAYLIFWLFGWALIRGGRLIEGGAYFIGWKIVCQLRAHCVFFIIKRRRFRPKSLTNTCYLREILYVSISMAKTNYCDKDL